MENRSYGQKFIRNGTSRVVGEHCTTAPPSQTAINNFKLPADFQATNACCCKGTKKETKEGMSESDGRGGKEQGSRHKQDEHYGRGKEAMEKWKKSKKKKRNKNRFRLTIQLWKIDYYYLQRMLPKSVFKKLRMALWMSLNIIYTSRYTHTQI